MAMAFACALIGAAAFGAVSTSAKEKDRVFVGCVENHNGKFELVTTSVKGKARNYTLAGSHDFAKDVGHRIRVSGQFSKRVVTAVKVTTVAATCRL